MGTLSNPCTLWFRTWADRSSELGFKALAPQQDALPEL